MESVIVGEATLDVLNSTPEITNQIFGTLMNNLETAIKPFLAIIGGLFGLYILYFLTHSILTYFRDKRIKQTHANTEEILKRLERIEKLLEKKKKK